MSKVMTSIVAPSIQQGSSGFADYGRRSRSEMIALYKQFAQERKAEAEAILNTADDDFIVEQFSGEYATRNRKRIDP